MFYAPSRANFSAKVDAVRKACALPVICPVILAFGATILNYIRLRAFDALA
jgi:hypothetical protein